MVLYVDELLCEIPCSAICGRVTLRDSLRCYMWMSYSARFLAVLYVDELLCEIPCGAICG